MQCLIADEHDEVATSLDRLCNRFVEQQIVDQRLFDDTLVSLLIQIFRLGAVVERRPASLDRHFASIGVAV